MGQLTAHRACVQDLHYSIYPAVLLGHFGARVPARCQAQCLHLLHYRAGQLDMFRIRVRKERLDHAAPTAHHVLDSSKIALRDTAALLRVPEEVA